MRKVLLVATRHSIFNQPVRRAFLGAGISLEEVDYRGNFILMPGLFTHRVAARLPAILRRPIFKFAQDSVDRKILKKAKQFKPDLIFILKAKDVGLGTIDKLRIISKTANWYPETFDHWENIRVIAPHYNYFFCYDPDLVESLKVQGYGGARYLPFCAEINNVSARPCLSKRKYDITFIGSFMPIRYAQREVILSQVKDLGLNIWGNKAWLGTSLRDCYRGRPSTEEMLQIYRDSKIVINVDLMVGIPGSGVNLRPFEITSCGALLLNHNDRRDIFNLFEDGKEFISFNGAEDIREKVLYCLQNQSKLDEMAVAGFEKTKARHTYANRIEEVINIIKNN